MKLHLLLKGIVQTHAILKEVLQKEHNLRDQKVLSHVAMVDIPKLNRTILLTDCGMNIAPRYGNIIEYCR